MPKKTNCLYSQVADALIAQINGHMYGKLLPSERALCEQYQVSRTTIRQALHLLAQRGYVDGVRGKGMVVSHPQLLQELHSVYNFHEEMRRQGKRPETHMVDFVVQAASGGLASVFSLQPRIPNDTAAPGGWCAHAAGDNLPLLSALSRNSAERAGERPAPSFAFFPLWVEAYGRRGNV